MKVIGVVAFIEGIAELNNLILQNPLVEIVPSQEGTEHLVEIPNSLYFGVGLSNGGGDLSQGVPLDVLSMILLGEKLSEEKRILVADTHALGNGLDKQEVDFVAGETQETLQKTVENLGLNGWTVERASSFDGSADYKNILSGMEGANDYIRRELTDMKWFEDQGIGMKVGWALKGSRRSDEVSFDKLFRDQVGGDLGFIYTVPGRTFDPSKQRAAPYFCGDPEARILLKEGEDVGMKFDNAREAFGDNGVKPVVNYLKPIAKMFNTTIEPLEQGPIEDRIQQIVDWSVK